MTSLISQDTILKTIDQEHLTHPMLQSIKEGSYVTRDGTDIHLVGKIWSNKISLDEPEFADFTCVKASDYGWVNVSDVHENYLRRYTPVNYKPAPMVMVATPRLRANTWTTIHKTDGGTYRILFDGQVHPLFVGYASIEEAQQVQRERVNYLIAMAQEATLAALKSDMEFPHIYLPVNVFLIAAGTSKDAWDGMFYDPDVMRQAVLGTKYLDSSGVERCEGRNALPGE